MKKVFSAIGGFFVKIWRWIKETAWIQPLLIVGLIFGLIFSIKPISEGISNLSESMANDEKYYKDNKVTLYSNKAYDFIHGNDGENLFKDDDKYFLLFIKSDCPECKTQYSGFKKLFTDETFKKDNYKMKTIYIDEQTSVEDPSADKNSLFYKLWYSLEGEDFRAAIADAGNGNYGSTYYYKTKVSDWETKLDDIEMGEDIYTPLILLMDKSFYEENPSSYGIKEVMLGLTEDSALSRAQQLEDCWKGEGDFERD